MAAPGRRDREGPGECDEAHSVLQSSSDRADARGWRTFVPSEPRPHGRGHIESRAPLVSAQSVAGGKKVEPSRSASFS